MNLEEILNQPFTFSVNCRSGYLGDNCQCSRCRKNRGEPVTEETEAEAVRSAEKVDADVAEGMKKFNRPLSAELEAEAAEINKETDKAVRIKLIARWLGKRRKYLDQK